MYQCYLFDCVEINEIRSVYVGEGRKGDKETSERMFDR